ncbi:DUF2179 domain-containing protein [Leptospira wolffii]|uniref:UPF0316 protein ACE5IX_02870 n=1 Tax=Leptospira wolffii TaxID=409998 RepID=A0A2M9ZFZ1_9LEPT|nr:DUF2179 domain-containing protein [Leptospira wolffii]EPG64217.1 PF10035 family protein [Leptospira wolffii serovar Khorat str. Khorat-H2]PJZ67342.1 DUF2179 domain-containing protein [Leptospira wolffii]TGK62336.1 DUF2179 domain-containing protein [Leptospira wolffii]TGK68147.1 DUF2179 domain-containing protein [Leptospira wolffii]TGK74280.1 DUF2179 domain-containing protein [Leptospira wolffii]
MPTWAFDYIILPLGIYLARMTDVSIGTVRIILISRERKALAAMLGFVEVLLWLIVITQIMRNLNNVLCYIAYGGGFATGTYLGMVIEEKLAIGHSLVRIIVTSQGEEIVRNLTEAGFRTTSLDASGARGPVKVILSFQRRKDIPFVLQILKNTAPNAFYTIENARKSSDPIWRVSGEEGDNLARLLWRRQSRIRK